MHEMGYTRDIIETVISAAENAHANEIRDVYLTIGEVRDIVDDIFVMCFEHFSKGTVAEKAKVHINRVPYTVRCEECGCTHPANIYKDDSFVCPECGQTKYRCETGMEFYIDHIEVA